MTGLLFEDVLRSNSTRQVLQKLRHLDVIYD